MKMRNKCPSLGKIMGTSNEAGHGVTDPGGTQTERRLRQHVCKCARDFRVPRQRQSFVCKRREGGETAEDADQQEESLCRIERLTHVAEAAEQADRQTAEHVHDESAVGECA